MLCDIKQTHLTAWRTNAKNCTIIDCSFFAKLTPHLYCCEAFCLLKVNRQTSTSSNLCRLNHKTPESTAQAGLILPWTAQLGQTLLDLHCLLKNQLPFAVSACIRREWHGSEQASGDQVVPLTRRILITDPRWNARRSTEGKKTDCRKRLFM